MQITLKQVIYFYKQIIFVSCNLWHLVILRREQYKDNTQKKIKNPNGKIKIQDNLVK